MMTPSAGRLWHSALCIGPKAILWSLTWLPGHLTEIVFEMPRRVSVLPQDPFGNYVVQYVLELGDTSASGAVMRGLAGHWPDLAQQKFSSNVVEKCLKLPGLAATQVLVVLCVCVCGCRVHLFLWSYCSSIGRGVFLAGIDVCSCVPTDDNKSSHQHTSRAASNPHILLYTGAGDRDQGADRFTAAGTPAAGCVCQLRHAVRTHGHPGALPRANSSLCHFLLASCSMPVLQLADADVHTSPLQGLHDNSSRKPSVLFSLYDPCVHS
jgi:Pumilio-family RNA binding repeat